MTRSRRPLTGLSLMMPGGAPDGYSRPAFRGLAEPAGEAGRGLVAQVFELADRIGRQPVGNVRELPSGGYRLRFQRDGRMRTAPEVFGTRSAAEIALWTMADDGRADFTQDGRFRAMVLLATFASLRWGRSPH